MASFTEKVRQILDVQMQIPVLVGFECFVFRPGRLRLQVTQIAQPMAAQAPVKAGA
jgi:hypothetical protein